MLEACPIEDAARRDLVCLAAEDEQGAAADRTRMPEKVAAGVFFLKDETRYFQNGTGTGDAAGPTCWFCRCGYRR